MSTLFGQNYPQHGYPIQIPTRKALPGQSTATNPSVEFI